MTCPTQRSWRCIDHTLHRLNFRSATQVGMCHFVPPTNTQDCLRTFDMEPSSRRWPKAYCVLGCAVSYTYLGLVFAVSASDVTTRWVWPWRHLQSLGMGTRTVSERAGEMDTNFRGYCLYPESKITTRGRKFLATPLASWSLLYTVSQKTAQLWNGIAQKYKDGFWRYLAEIFKSL